MNKTRMGKRAASLLLSLVMMLSLLPTAAYAAMGNADETQGAIVSENGTGVSDDSNSSGNTDDLQVGGSSGSGTADDTTGAEGGADPTDSANGNDSADPQDGEGAVTKAELAAYVTVNGDTVQYDTLDAAIAAAEPNENGVITYTISGKVEVTSTEAWIQVAKAGLTGLTAVKFVGAGEDAEISITNSTSVLADQNYDIDVSFVDLTLSHSNGAWVGDLGHATEYFTCVLRNTDAANNTVTYTNCTFPNGACNNQYGKTVFVNCEFTNTTSGKYNLWNYGGTTEITKSAFTGTRGIKTYNEGTLAESPEVAIKDTTFTGLTEKAAIVASKPTDIKLDSISATECTKGVFQKDIEGSADAEKVTIEANGSGISGNFNVTAEKTAEAAKDEFNITAGSFTAEVPGDYCAEGFTIEKKPDGSYGVKEDQPSANVAKVGDTEYATLADAIAALSSNSYTLELLDETAWDEATPVYWAAGSKSGYVATLADALTAAYMANAGGITIVCRPGADVGKLTHGHVADDITIYGNNAYISSGECELEVDTYMFSRETGKQATTGGAYLEKDITVTAYELDNLGVWGQRHTDHKVTVNLTDCDSVNGITVQRVYISGTTGVNDITLTGCDFATKATSVYSNADGAVVIDNCSFTGAQVPVNFNHKANGKQTVTVRDSKFTNCGDNGDWKQFAAPVRFVNSGSGTMNTTVNTCTFTGTVGGNGDILLGDGREGQKSNDVSLNVANTAATVQAQQPGYYGDGGTTDESKQGTKTVAAGETLTTSVTQLMPSSELTDYVMVSGIKGFENTKFATFAEAYAAIKPVVATLGLGQETPADAAAFDAVFTDISTDGKATLTYTITGNVTYDETGLDHLLTMGRSSSHYLTNERHLINFKFVGAEADRGATLTVNSNITLPYEWWGEKITTSISFENLTITGSAPSGLFANQSFFEGIDFKVNNCTLKGIKIYNCANVGGSYTITNSKLDGTGAAKDAYAIHLQGNDTAPLNILIENNQISGYDRGVNIDQATAIATISGNSISINDSDRSCVQLTQLAKTTVSGNTMTLTGGNAITLHGNLAAGSKIDVIGNNITGTGYLIYDAAKGTIDLTYTDNTVSDTIDTTKGVYGGKEYKVSENVANALKPDTTTSVAEVNGVKYDSLQAAIDAASRKTTVTMLANTKENVTISTSDLTLDLNGHTLNGGTVAGKPALTVTARVTVKDGSAAQTGTIMREDTAENSGVSSHYVIDVQGAGWLTFESGKVTNDSGNDSGNGASLVRVGDDSIAKYPGLNIKGGTFTQDNFIVIKVDSGDLFLNGGTLNSANSYAIEDWHRAAIKGGTVNGEVAAWTYSGGHNSDLTISGGTVNGDVTSVNYGSAEGKVAKVSITGGTVNGALDTRSYDPSTNELTSIDDATKATIKVTGGTFKEDPSKYVVENSGVTKNDDGTFGVAKAYLAQVGDTSYYTMDEAFKAQTASGEAIVLLRDYTTGSTFNSGTIARTVDLNGHTWTCTGTDANSAAFEINNPNATLTVKNGKVVSSQLVGLIPSAMGGTIKYDNSTLEFEGVEMTTTAHSGIETNGNNTNDTVTLRNSTLNVPNGFGIYFPSSGTLTIDNSKINAKTMGVQVCSGSLNISGAGTAITVSGDGIDKTINDGAIEDGAAISIVNRIGYKGLDEIKVEGGTFTANGTNAAVKAYNWKDLTPSDFTQNDKVSVSGGTFSSAVDKSLCADGYIPTQNADGTFGVKVGQYVAEVNGAKYATLAEAIDAAQDGQTVRLLADATEDVVISKSITLDLGGKTLTNTNVGKATISVKSGTVTVKNGNVVGGNDYYNIEVTKGSNANLTLTDVTATAGNNGSSMIDNWGTLTITSGTYTGGMNTVKNEPSAKLNITGGTFTLTKGNSNGFTGVVFNYGELTISGGEFIQSDKSAPYGQAQVIHTDKDKNGSAAPSTVITGGTFKNLCTRSTAWTVRATNAAAGAMKVSGGAFNKSIPEGYCADGFIPTKNADGTYGVKEGQYVAEIGSKKYETLADAIRLATKGKTITLLADVADCGSLTISKNITLDGGGHTISGNSSISVNMPGNAAADVTIKNVNFKDIANGNKLSAFYFSQVKGKLTITGCTFDSIEYEAIQVTPMEGAEVNVSSNVFKAKADGTQVRHIHIEMAYGSGFDCEGQNIKLTVTDNQLHGTVSGDASMGIWWVGTDSTLKVDGNYMEHPETVSITLSNGGVHYNRGDLIYPARSQADADVDDLIPAVIVADKASGESKIKAYSTLADAVAAAQDGQTVRLLADVEQNTQLTIGKSITLDLNGKTIRNTKDIWGDTANAILSIKNGAKVTITGNGTIDAKENDCYTINVAKGDLTIENGTFYGNVSVVQVEEGTLSIKGGTFDLHQKWEGSSKYLFNCIDSEFTSGNAKVAISGGTFVGFDPNVSPEQKVDGKTPSFAAPGAGIIKNEDGSFTAAAGMTAQILDKDGNSVKAYKTLAEAVAAAEDGQTVRLLADVTLDAQIATGKAITIDGQSKYTIKTVKKLASADGKAGMFYRTQSAKGTLTFLNVTLDGGGVSKIFLNEGGAGETVFDGVTSTNGGGIAYGSGIHISGGGSHATIRNSTLTGSTGTMELNDANYYAANDLWVGGNVYVTVENSVIGNVFVNSAPSATATNGVVHGQLTITGEKTKITYLSGEEEAADKLDKFGNNGSLVKIDSGYVEKVFDKGSYAISGGTFKTEVKKEWCAAGYVPTQNADGTYGVEVGKFTVQVTSRTTGSNSPVANVTGGGSNITYAQGTTVTASAISGYKFVGWFVNEYTGTPYSTDLTCEVKPTDDCTMIAVYEPISGGVFALEVSASKFTVNGGATQRSYLLEKMPVGTQVTVVFKGSENFLYWVNESGKVVSTSKTYTFSMGSATTLKAVYAEKEENQAMVVFISHTQQVISSKGYTDTQEIQFPEPPIKMGATFVRWSMTEAEIRAAMATTTTGIIVVEPVYEFSAGSYTVTVNYPNDETATYTATVGKITTVTAKSIDGKVFKCWKNGDTVLGYTETLKIAPRGDLTLTAEYVDAGTTVDRLPVIALTEISASQQGAKYAVSFTATRSVPDGYTVTEQGILVSTNSRYGQSDALDAMKLDANGAKPDDTFILKATNTDATGVTVLNGTVSAADRTVYGRAYMILRDSSGAMVYVYSDTILSGSYNSLTTNGGN